MSTVSGIDFIALQVRDVAKSAHFYEDVVGLTRAPAGPPNAVVFATTPIPFAVRTPDIDLDSVGKVGAGVALWFCAEDADKLYAKLTEKNVPIAVEPFDGPFGRTFAFVDPDGYVVTMHDKG